MQYKSVDVVMENEYLILDQIKQLKANPYKVPVSYFEGLSDAILLRVNFRKNTYNTPENYFENLPSAILQKVKQTRVREVEAELETIAPLLNTISKQPIYSVPQHYFEHLSVYKQAEVVQLYLQKKWLKYAVAAAVVSVVSVAALLYNNNGNNQALMASYQQAVKTNIESSLPGIADDDLANALNETTALAATNFDESKELPWNNLSNLQSEFEFVSDEELSSYVQENKITNDTPDTPHS